MKPVLDAATAAGTVGVVIVTYRLAKREREASERNEATRAEMAWARIAPELWALHRNVEHAALAVRSIADQHDGDTIRDGTRSLLQQTRAALSLENTSRSLPDLVVRSDVSLQLAAILGQMPKVLRQIDALLSMGDVLPNGANINAFIILEELCSLGEKIDGALGKVKTKYFDLAWHEALAVKLGIRSPEDHSIASDFMMLEPITTPPPA
jgi:hypothetical protein